MVLDTATRSGRPVVLASAALLTPSPDAAPAAHRLAAEVRAWAEEAGLHLVALPARGLDVRPDADAAERRRLGRRDTAALQSLFARIARELGDGLPAALLVAEDEVSGQTGRAWLRRLSAAADAARLPLPRAIRLAPAAPLDADLLDRRVLASVD